MKPEDVPQEWVEAMRSELSVWPPTADLRAALAAVAPLIAAAEREALRAEVARVSIEREVWFQDARTLRAEVASLRVTLGQQPPADGAEPIGCPLPGMCAMVEATGTLRARVEVLEAALRGVLSIGVLVPESYCPGMYAAMETARDALEGKGHE